MMIAVLLWPVGSLACLLLYALGAARTRHHAPHHLSKRHGAKTVGVGVKGGVKRFATHFGDHC